MVVKGGSICGSHSPSILLTKFLDMLIERGQTSGSISTAIPQTEWQWQLAYSSPKHRT